LHLIQRCGHSEKYLLRKESLQSVAGQSKSMKIVSIQKRWIRPHHLNNLRLEL